MPISYWASARQIFMLRLIFIQLKELLVCSKFYVNPDLLPPLRLGCTSLCLFSHSFLTSLFKIKFPRTFLQVSLCLFCLSYNIISILCSQLLFPKSDHFTDLVFKQKILKINLTDLLMQNEKISLFVHYLLYGLVV